jgi:hypothetical protein
MWQVPRGGQKFQYALMPVQYLVGPAGVPRRYSDYPNDYILWNIVSSIGSTISLVTVQMFTFVTWERWWHFECNRWLHLLIWKLADCVVLAETLLFYKLLCLWCHCLLTSNMWYFGPRSRVIFQFLKSIIWIVRRTCSYVGESILIVLYLIPWDFRLLADATDFLQDRHKSKWRPRR